jgi:hypothetical protein
LEPHQNVYDTRPFPLHSNCSFDPVDDGNDEEDFFDPADPTRRFGPSSTCWPERGFVDQGDTFSPFDPQNLGDADGPGLEGEVGAGTWVQPIFDLSRYRGRRVQLRLLQTGIQFIAPTWEDTFSFNPTARDDGWFVDDITVTDTLVQAADLTVDTKDNLDLLADWDLDGVGATCDCAPEDGEVWLPAVAVSGLRLQHSGGAGGETRITWESTVDPGTPVAYDVLVSLAPDGFGASGLTECLEAADASDRLAIDRLTPDPAAARYYLVRAAHTCGAALGTDSDGQARTGIDC